MYDKQYVHMVVQCVYLSHRDEMLYSVMVKSKNNFLKRSVWQQS